MDEPAPTNSRGLRRLLRRVPWIVWAAILPALIIGASKLYTGGGTRVPLVGAGPVALARHEDAPPGSHLVTLARAHEPLEDSARRVREVISRWPDVLVIGLDPAQLGDDPEAAVALLGALAHEATNATAVPVLVGFGRDPSDPIRARAERAFREGPCRAGGRHVCVELDHPSDPVSVRAALRAGIADALSLHRQWRASTQGR